MITETQVVEYNRIRKSSGNQAADSFAQNVISELNLDLKGRISAWGLFRAEMKAEEKAPRKKPPQKNTASIKKNLLEDTRKVI